MIHNVLSRFFLSMLAFYLVVLLFQNCDLVSPGADASMCVMRDKNPKPGIDVFCSWMERKQWFYSVLPDVNPLSIGFKAFLKETEGGNILSIVNPVQQSAQHTKGVIGSSLVSAAE